MDFKNIFFQIISRLSSEFLAPDVMSPSLPYPRAHSQVSEVGTDFPGNFDPCLKTTGHHSALPRNAENVNGGLTQTGAVP